MGMRQYVLGKRLCAGLSYISSSHAELYGPAVRICEVSRVDGGQAPVGVVAQLLLPVAHAVGMSENIYTVRATQGEGGRIAMEECDGNAIKLQGTTTSQTRLGKAM